MIAAAGLDRQTSGDVGFKSCSAGYARAEHGDAEKPRPIRVLTFAQAASARVRNFDEILPSGDFREISLQVDPVARHAGVTVEFKIELVCPDRGGMHENATSFQTRRDSAWRPRCGRFPGVRTGAEEAQHPFHYGR